MGARTRERWEFGEWEDIIVHMFDTLNDNCSSMDTGEIRDELDRIKDQFISYIIDEAIPNRKRVERVRSIIDMMERGE